MPVSNIIPVLSYPDIATAVDWLMETFGFTLRLRIQNHRAQMNVGNGSVILTNKGWNDNNDLWKSTHSIIVRIEDVNAHYKHSAQHNAKIIQIPTDQVYGERQYTAEDLVGHQWTFSQTLADIDPEEWGGELIDN